MAVPLLSVLVPSTVAPSLNVTVPAGDPAPGETTLTVAVKVTSCPKTDGFAEEFNTVNVFAAFTVWESVGDALELKLVLPA